MKTRLLAFFLLISCCTFGQTPVPFDSSDWIIAGKVTKDVFLGKDCIRLTEGMICLKDSTFKNGVIEFDMTLSSNRYFPGLGFRVQDKANFESVYLRPHQLGNPDAIQYTPVFNGQAGWQLYYGDGYSNAITYPLNEWVPIKIVVRDSQAEVYIGNVKEPSLVIHQLKRNSRAGQICLDNSSSAPTRFANFQYTKTDNPPLAGKFKPKPAPQPGTILNWQVSNTFDEKLLQTDFIVPQALGKQLTWTGLPTETTGILNLAQISKLGERSNAVFVKQTLVSDKAQVKKLQLGFSDRARVYLNGQLLYAGHDEFVSRDYRFLGTIGYFDEVYLNLKKGKNELWMAISENFGGWGLKAMIADQSGLTIEP